MILNIISRTNYTTKVGGAIKVFKNLVAGLDRLNYPYVVNKALDSCEYLWVHDDYRALLSLRNIDPRVRIVLGPNMFVMPRDIHRKSYIPPSAVYLQPCQWAVDLWKSADFDACRMDVWPVGIDVDSMPQAPREEADQILLYVKERDPQGLVEIERILAEKKLPYAKVVYGSYKQEDFIAKLLRSRYVIWYGRHESQGLALQEALAMDRPIIVLDVKTLRDYYPQGPFTYDFTEKELAHPVTAAPYFDDRCGVKIDTIAELPQAIERMEREHHLLQPKAFILEHLTLEAGARHLLSLYEKWWDGPPTYAVNSRYLPAFVPRRDWVQIPIERRLKAAAKRLRK